MAKRKKKRVSNGRKAIPKTGVTLSGPKGKVTLADLGIKTPAAKRLTVVEDAVWFNDKGEKVNPNGVKRARRISWVQHYTNKGLLDKRQLAAALWLQEAFEATQRRPPAIKQVNVDSSPKPDANVSIMIDRQSRYHSVAKHVPEQYKLFISRIVLDNEPIRAKGRARERYAQHLAQGLNILANNLGL